MSDEENYLDDEELDEGEELDAELDQSDEEQLNEEGEHDPLDEDAEEEKEPEENPINRDHLYGGALSLLESIGSGLSCAYVRLDVPKLGLTDISMLEKFIHLRYLDLSDNHLTNITPICTMTHLCSLNVNKNRLSSLRLDELPYLQTADLGHNRLTSMEGITHPLLEELILESNRIPRMSFPDPNRMVGLRILNLRGNKITSLAVDFPPNLEELYLASNMISSLEDMRPIPRLKKLHLRENQLEKIEGLEDNKVESLAYLNLRGNNIVEIRDIRKLRDVPTITEIVMQENPIEDNDDYREEVIAILGARKTLKRIDKDAVDAEELTLGMDRMEKIDREFEEEEAAARAEELAKEAEKGIPSDMAIKEEKSTESELQFTMNASINSGT